MMMLRTTNADGIGNPPLEIPRTMYEPARQCAIPRTGMLLLAEDEPVKIGAHLRTRPVIPAPIQCVMANVTEGKNRSM